jgi:hypothetical protein
MTILTDEMLLGEQNCLEIVTGTCAPVGGALDHNCRVFSECS